MNKLLYDYLVKNNVKLEDINKFAFDFDEDLGVKMFARVTQSILGG